jgi:hypothetical protein
VRELEIDWAGLHSAFQMNMPGVRCFLSLQSGEVLKIPPGDQNITAVRAAPDEYAAVEAIPSRIQYQWLDQFIQSVEDETLCGRMTAAINGKGAFRRFKDILLTVPDERRRWFEFRDQVMRDRIIEWVAELGISPTNEPDWNDKGGKDSDSDNAAEDVEALRDFMIDWAEGKDASALKPMSLEQLAHDICEKFNLRSKS